MEISTHSLAKWQRLELFFTLLQAQGKRFDSFPSTLHYLCHTLQRIEDEHAKGFPAHKQLWIDSCELFSYCTVSHTHRWQSVRHSLFIHEKGAYGMYYTKFPKENMLGWPICSPIDVAHYAKVTALVFVPNSNGEPLWQTKNPD